MVTNNYPEELIATGYYANSLPRFTNGLEISEIPVPMSTWDKTAGATHCMLLGDPGCSLTQKETFRTTALVSPRLLQYWKTQVAKEHFVWTGDLPGNLLLRCVETFMNRRTFSICNDHFQLPWEYHKSSLPRRQRPSVAEVTLQCINALFMCLDSGRWSRWLQGLCCV